MDGNGRWGKKRGKSRNFGHLKGVKIIEKLVKYSIKLQIPILTFYTFSTENWKRPKKEVSALMSLLLKTIKDEIKRLEDVDLEIGINPFIRQHHLENITEPSSSKKALSKISRSKAGAAGTRNPRPGCVPSCLAYLAESGPVWQRPGRRLPARPRYTGR